MEKKHYHFTPAVRNGRFECKVHEVKEGFLATTVSVLCSSLVRRFSPWQRRECIDWVDQQAPLLRSQQPRITWIGHATFLIQIGSVNILTDPIFGNASFLYPRITPPGIAFEGLPPIDIVLISHSHYDHMESASIKALARNKETCFVVPRGNIPWFTKRGISNVIEHTWWESTTINKLTYMFLPAVHWTQRTPFDRNRSLWGSWMISYQDTHIYFAGDTALGKHFEHIANLFPVIDTAILPIGPCEPRAMMCHAHMDAADAGEAFRKLNARNLVPMHWGTFRFGDEEPDLPMKRLIQWWDTNRQNLNPTCLLHTMKIGRPILLEPSYMVPSNTENTIITV